MLMSTTMASGVRFRLSIVVSCLLVLGISLSLSEDGSRAAITLRSKQVPILLSFAGKDPSVPDHELAPVKFLQPSSGFHGYTDQVRNILRMVVHGAEKHTPRRPAAFHKLSPDSIFNTTVEYIDEWDQEEQQNEGRRQKRWAHHHHPHHHQHKPVSLDFGCNSDNTHDIQMKDKQRLIGSFSTTSDSTESNEKHPLSLFIKRPNNHMRPHHHGPHLTFRCNTNNHHTVRSYRNFRTS